jgi:mannose-6-phosphate isomerase-like protein (cupin superfamily)
MPATLGRRRKECDVAGIERRSFSQPDEKADYGDQGSAAKVTVGMAGFGIGSESTLWLSTLRPGWSWLRNIKPGVPFESCPLHHREYVISGRIRYVMDDGSAVEAGAGDHLLIEPGHLAEVVGDETCVLLDW